MAQAARTFRIFVSSTFHDLKEERNALQERVFPRLRELCLQHGTRFQAIDLRWGVSEQASLDQQAMNICLGEIARCQKTTPRPNFIMLLGDRYGWRPLPCEIPADEFEEIEGRIAHVDDRALLTTWYRRDDNAVPPEYCLQPRTGEFEDYGVWEERVERPLQKILAEAIEGMDLTPEQRLKYVASATHQEIAHGALQVENAADHVFCFFRSIRDLPLDLTARGFLDLDEAGSADLQAHQQLDNLKKQLRRLLPGNVHEYEAAWTGSGASTDHIEQLCDDVYKCLSQVILEEAGGFILEEVGPPEESDPLEMEIVEHREFGIDRARFFVGREEILEAIAEYLRGTDPHPLAVWGESGSGKSALMAKAIQQAVEMHPESELVFRFVGATPESSNGRALLEGLCRQIYRGFNFEEQKRQRSSEIEETSDEKAAERRQQIQVEYSIPSELRELSMTFQDFLVKIPVEQKLILFLDALDQLSDADNARILAWLPAELPEHVRLVVSTLPGECRSVLKGKLRPENLVELKPMPPEQGSELLDLWLQDAGRTLQQHQRDEVLGKFNEEGNGLPLYLKLAFEEARRWKSYTDREETILRPDVPGVIRDLFARLSAEGNHGEMLVSRSLGYLAAAKNGLTEDELLDVLSRDVELYAWFLESLYHTPPDLVECVQEHLESAPSIRLKEQRGETVDDKAAEEWLNDLRQDGPGLLEFLSTVLAKPNGEGLRLPVVLWSRLYFDLEPYVTKRSGDGTALLGFYHRQLGEVTQEEYLSREDKLQRHQTLAKYFEGQPLQVDRDEQETPNLRKLSELPYQQAHAEMWDEVRATLTHFDFLQTKIDAVGPQPLIGDYAETLNAGFDSQTLRLVEGALRLSNHVLVEDPTQTAGQLTGRLLSSDLPAIQSLLDQTRSWGRPWLRPLTPSLASPGGALIRTLTGHTSLVHEVVVTPDGRRAISVSDSTMKVWDLDSGTELATLAGHSDELVISVAVTPDGRRAISASGDKTLKLWDLDSGTELFTFSGHAGAINRVVVSPDGRRAISSSDDQTLKVWELEAGSELTTLTGHTDSIGSVVVTPDGHRAVSGCADGMLKVWDLETGAELATLTGHTAGRVTWVAVTPDGQSAVSAALDGRLKVWDLDTGTELADLTGHTGFVTMVVVVPGGHRAVSGCADGTLNVWDLDLGTELVTFRGHSAAIHRVAVTPDGSLVISASQDSTLKVWDLESGTELATLTGHSDSVNCVVLTPDGQHAISGSSDGTLMMWDLDAATGLAALPGHSEWVSAVALTADARRGVSASRDGTLKVWDLESGTELATLAGHSRAATGVAVTPDGRRALSASWDKTLKLWDLNSGTELATLAGHGSSVYDVAITPDGRRAISASNDKTLKVWDLHSATELATLAGHTERVWRVRVTPGGRRALSASWDKTLKVWDLDSGTELAALTGHNREVKGMVVTPDGRRAVSVAADLSLVVWDLDGGSLLGTLSGHKSGLYDVAITPDGRRALSASWDKTLMLWDLNSGTELATLTGHTEGVRRVVVTPDGRHAVSASADRTLKVWDLRDATLLATFTSGADVVATAVSPSPTGPTILAGDRLGQVHIVRLEGIDRVPMQAPVLTAHRMWLSGERGRNGRWEDEITAVCQWCGQRSPVEDEVLSTITSITREADLSPHQSPCVELLTEVWGEPGLLSECARCHGRLRFNPFLVDNREQEPLWREAQQKRELARSLRDQAKALKDQGDLDHALSLHREEERIYIELGDDGSLALCLASQGMILHALGEFGAAMAAFQEAEPLYRQSGDVGGVATMISNQAFLLGKMGRAQAALPLAEAAHRLATDHGLTSKAEGIGKILEFLRRKAAG